MNTTSLNEKQLQKMKSQPGFIAALDQSGGSTPGALKLYGIKDDAWSNEDEMFAIVHQMRTRIITSPALQRRSDSWRDSLREHHGPGNPRAAHRRLSLEREACCAVLEGGQRAWLPRRTGFN